MSLFIAILIIAFHGGEWWVYSVAVLMYCFSMGFRLVGFFGTLSAIEKVGNAAKRRFTV